MWPAICWHPSNKDKDRLALGLRTVTAAKSLVDLSSVVHNCRPDEYPYPKAIELSSWLRRWLEQKS